MPERISKFMPNVSNKMPDGMPAKMPERMSDRMPEIMSDTAPIKNMELDCSQVECQKERQIECQTICQIKCRFLSQIDCKIRSQNIWQIECQVGGQNIRPMDCQLVGITRRKLFLFWAKDREKVAPNQFASQSLMVLVGKQSKIVFGQCKTAADRITEWQNHAPQKLTIYLKYIWHIFWHFIWRSLWHSIWHKCWPFTWQSPWQCICYRHSSCHTFWLFVCHSICVLYGIASDTQSDIRAQGPRKFTEPQTAGARHIVRVRRAVETSIGPESCRVV